jgi:hypothetical protein
MQYSRDIVRQIITFVAIISAFGMNIWANISPPNGLTIGEISNTLFQDVLITPTNYAFAIWGVIYLGLISFAIYQALPSQTENSLGRSVGYKIAGANIAQIVWLFCFLNRQFALYFVAMVAILIQLILAYLKINKRSYPRQQQWFICIPISIYTAWISVATIVNAATVLDFWNWDGWGINPEIWTAIMLVVTGVIGSISAMQKNIPFVGVYLWALIAIAVRNSGTILISTTAIIMVIILSLLLLTSVWNRSTSGRKIGNI